MTPSKIVPIRFQPKLLAAVTKEATKRGMTVSAYIKFVLQKELEK
jgi:predicted DNA binding CopG/RHH family protein